MKVQNIFPQIEIHILNQYLITFGFSIIGALINFFFFRQVYVNIGEDTFYFYAYSRRIISFLSPILLLGIGISLPRAIGHSSTDQTAAANLFIVSFSIISLASLIWLLLNLFFNKWITGIIWGEATLMTQNLNIALAICLLSINITACIHSYFRGKIDAMTAGTIDILAQSILPLTAFLLISNLVSIYYTISVLVMALNIVVIYMVLKKATINVLKRKFFFNHVLELLSYGIRRVPGDIFYSFLVFVPSFFAGYIFNIQLAGVFAFGLSLLTLFNLPATAISFVTLSRSATLIISDRQKLREETGYLIIIGLLYSFLVLIVLYYFLDSFLTIFFDKEFLKHSQTLFKLLWALPVLVVFTILRSITDSAYKRPFNSYFIFVALIVFGAFSIFALNDSNPLMLIYGNTAAYFSLAFLSLLIVRKTLTR